MRLRVGNKRPAWSFFYNPIELSLILLYNFLNGTLPQRRYREEMNRMTKEELTLEVIERLRKEYPDAGCTLDYDQAWKLLVSVRLAAQCTDARAEPPAKYRRGPLP